MYCENVAKLVNNQTAPLPIFGAMRNRYGSGTLSAEGAPLLLGRFYENIDPFLGRF